MMNYLLRWSPTASRRPINDQCAFLVSANSQAEAREKLVEWLQRGFENATDEHWLITELGDAPLPAEVCGIGFSGRIVYPVEVNGGSITEGQLVAEGAKA